MPREEIQIGDMFICETGVCVVVEGLYTPYKQQWVSSYSFATSTSCQVCVTNSELHEQWYKLEGEQLRVAQETMAHLALENKKASKILLMTYAVMAAKKGIKTSRKFDNSMVRLGVYQEESKFAGDLLETLKSRINDEQTKKDDNEKEGSE